MFPLAEAATHGLPGFLPGSRASFMLDVVFLAMFAIVPLLLLSVFLVRRRRYSLHKRLQLTLAAILLVAVGLFEIDMQLFTRWETLADGSRYFDPANKWGSPAGLSLLVHLAFAIPTLILWIVVVAAALARFPNPPHPAPHSRWHTRLGWLATIGMLLTALTGWLFYALAFIAGP